MSHIQDIHLSVVLNTLPLLTGVEAIKLAHLCVLQVPSGASMHHYDPPRSYLLRETFTSLRGATSEDHLFFYEAIPHNITFVHV